MDKRQSVVVVAHLRLRASALLPFSVFSVCARILRLATHFARAHSAGASPIKKIAHMVLCVMLSVMLCVMRPLEHSGLAEHLQKYKRRVVHRGDSVKDDAGCQAVFTEQGASASQMTAAKVVDTISRLPRMAGKTDDAPILLTLSTTECSTIWIRLPRHSK